MAPVVSYRGRRLSSRRAEGMPAQAIRTASHFMANVDSLHILSDRPWRASRKMLRSRGRAQGLSERQRVKTVVSIGLLRAPLPGPRTAHSFSK